MTEQYKKTAYHESGHVVMAYYARYTCDEVAVLMSGDGKTTTDYGDDLLLIAAITNFIDHPQIFNELPKEIRENSSYVGFKAAVILLAGSIAEEMYLNNGGIKSDTMTFELVGPDGIRVHNINFVLSKVLKEHSSNFIAETMEMIMGTFAQPEVWNTLSTLAEAIVAKEGMKLTKMEIEEILNSTGYFEYIKMDN